jgi:hypothetical protein
MLNCLQQVGWPGLYNLSASSLPAAETRTRVIRRHGMLPKARWLAGNSDVSGVGPLYRGGVVAVVVARNAYSARECSVGLRALS